MRGEVGKETPLKKMDLLTSHIFSVTLKNTPINIFYAKIREYVNTPFKKLYVKTRKYVYTPFNILYA